MGRRVSVVAAPIPRGAAESRLRDPLVLGIFAGAFAAAILVAVAVVVLRAPGAVQGPCAQPPLCPPPSSAPRLVNNTPWPINGLGVSLEYDSGIWAVKTDGTGARSLRLVRDDGTELDLVGTTGSDVSSAFAQRVNELKSTYKNVNEHAGSDGRQVLGPSIGYVDGGARGAAFCGTDGNSYVDAIVMAATDGHVTLVATLLTHNCHVSPMNDDQFQAADNVLKTVRWGGA